MLLELAVADAYGAAFEGMPGPLVRRYNRLDGYRPMLMGRRGAYTDDTQMAMAVAEVMASAGTTLASVERSMNRFRQWGPRYRAPAA